MHNEIELLTLQQRRTLHMGLECYKNITNKESGLHNMFTSLNQVRTRTTRQTESLGLLIPDLRSHMGRYAFSYRGAKFWTNLDPTLRKEEELNGFKGQLIKQICRNINHPT